GDPLEIASRMTYQSTHHYKTALFQWKTWSRVLTGKVDYWGLSKTFASRFGKLIASRAVAIAGALSGRGSDSAIAPRFKAAARRGAESLLVFSGGDEGLDLVFLHLGGGAAAMKGFDNFKLEIVEGPDHTFTQIWAQRWLIDTIVGRVASRWGLPARS
ncbi:MAG: hypothetical protein JST92_19370, partial [Deltaproteobacteria bacterium]|nr:hypothetical protein [Deltaproteobacteria bacterium]